MTNKEKINKIGEVLNRLDLWDLSYDQLCEEMENMKISEIKDHMWELYCFVSDVCDIVNE